MGTGHEGVCGDPRGDDTSGGPTVLWVLPRELDQLQEISPLAAGEGSARTLKCAGVARPSRGPPWAESTLPDSKPPGLHRAPPAWEGS